MITDQIVNMIKDSKNKTLLEVGSHDDTETLELAKYFKKVYSYYEYLKISERTEGNIEIKKKNYLDVLKDLNKFDVLLMENEFHHFPDIWQMWTYKKLRKGQELFIVEWNQQGNSNEYYKFFQNCLPLCKLTQEVLNKFVLEGLIKILSKTDGNYEETIVNKKEMINYYKFMLPDHWEFGKNQFLKKIKDTRYPIRISEGYTIYQIVKI